MFEFAMQYVAVLALITVLGACAVDFVQHGITNKK